MNCSIREEKSQEEKEKILTRLMKKNELGWEKDLERVKGRKNMSWEWGIKRKG